ncbi:hypothetical protein RV11_GL003154 [Enterococcus phoeniculicola]|nr:hypothetical protein RV11_GL003154 [Enterococcus phoeniculicola]
MSTLFVFFIASFVTGVCLTGIMSLYLNNSSLKNSDEILPLFLMPVTFGGLTLLLIIGGIIRLIVDYFKEEYILWSILGSKPTQISFLVGGQLALTGFIGGVLGYFCAFPFAQYAYFWIQDIVGKKMLPDIQLGFSFSAFLITILLITMLGGLGGIVHSRKIFILTQSNVFMLDKQEIKKQSRFKKTMIILCSFILLVCFYFIFKGVPSTGNIPKGVMEIQLCFAVMFFLIILLNLLSSRLFTQIVKILMIVFPKKKAATLNTAFWSVLSDNNYLSSIVAPMVTASVLLSGFSTIMINFLNQLGSLNANQQNTENLLSLLLFLGAPLLLIVSNIVGISIIFGKQQENSIKQLRVLGFSTWTAIVEKLFEVLIYSITFLIVSIGCNLVTSILVIRIAHSVIPDGSVSWSPVFLLTFYLFWVMFVFMGVVKIIQIKKSSNVSDLVR